MAPERLVGNLWRLLKNEYIEAESKRIDGPMVVRIHELESGFLRVQGGEIIMEFKTPDFPSVVRRLGNQEKKSQSPFGF